MPLNIHKLRITLGQLSLFIIIQFVIFSKLNWLNMSVYQMRVYIGIAAILMIISYGATRKELINIGWMIPDKDKYKR